MSRLIKWTAAVTISITVLVMLIVSWGASFYRNNTLTARGGGWSRCGTRR